MSSQIVHTKVLAGRAGACVLPLRSAVVAMAMAMAAPAFAYHHHDLQVKFQDYASDVVARNLGQQRPYFLLFSAEWCHWCHEFADHTLVREEVYDYLNEHFVNVFIDADIHTAASVKYRAKGLPFTVFLNPDGSVHFRYTGTLYGDQFIEVLREIRSNIERNVAIPGQDATVEPYESPDTLDTEDLVALGEAFRDGILENFDPAEHGVGRGEKAILPRTFLYLLEHAGEAEREDAVAGVAGTLGRAIEAIYDPVEGGFFRYAETRDWQVPHYEKMADLNAGATFWCSTGSTACPPRRPSRRQASARPSTSGRPCTSRRGARSSASRKRARTTTGSVPVCAARRPRSRTRSSRTGSPARSTTCWTCCPWRPTRICSGR